MLKCSVITVMHWKALFSFIQAYIVQCMHKFVMEFPQRVQPQMKTYYITCIQCYGKVAGSAMKALFITIFLKSQTN